MTTSLDFQDSEIGLTENRGEELLIAMAAAYVERIGEGSDKAARLGYLAGVSLIFGQARCSGNLADALGALGGGWVLVNGVRLNRLPLPFTADGEIHAELSFRRGCTLKIDAQSLRCEVADPTQFVESFAC